MNKTNIKTKFIGVNVAPELKQKLKRIAKEDNRSVASLIKVAIDDVLVKYEGQQDNG